MLACYYREHFPQWMVFAHGQKAFLRMFIKIGSQFFQRIRDRLKLVHGQIRGDSAHVQIRKHNRHQEP